MKKQISLIEILRILLLVLIVLNVAFIFFQSTLSPEESVEKSDEVGDIIAEVIPPETPVGGYVQDNVRKIAHFVEFMMLGIWSALYVVLTIPTLKWCAISFPPALLCALLDESIQIFSERGPSVSDVWLDFLGFCSSAVIIYTGYAIFSIMRNKMQTKVDKI